ncbi:two-component system, chemotaxis family, response regulator WspR [Candidatus Magnetomoraceae bacterium gMMP-1]
MTTEGISKNLSYRKAVMGHTIYSENKKSKSKGKILVVDDEPENLRLLMDMLSKRGYIVYPSINGEMALEFNRSACPDIILLDIRLPGMDGYEVCRRLKADERTKSIPIIFISALEDISNKINAFDVGCVDYISKPFKEELVLARIKAHLAMHGLQKKLKIQNQYLCQEIKKLRRLASLDGLTQIANRRHFDEYLKREWKRRKREQESLSLIMCDIDYFKLYNDTYGHPAGDEILRQIAKVIERAARRPADLAARYGGEEFVIVLPNTDAEGALKVAQFIFEDVNNLKIPHKQSTVCPYITLSIGVTVGISSCVYSAEVFLNTADQALYEAKEQGRNTIVLKFPC